jgi:hypothetical protein
MNMLAKFFPRLVFARKDMQARENVSATRREKAMGSVMNVLHNTINRDSSVVVACFGSQTLPLPPLDILFLFSPLDVLFLPSTYSSSSLRRTLPPLVRRTLPLVTTYVITCLVVRRRLVRHRLTLRDSPTSASGPQFIGKETQHLTMGVPSCCSTPSLDMD